jgi:hypothetical protein
MRGGSGYTGGAGGSGIIILRSSAQASARTGGTETTVGSDYVYTFTSSGSITF